MCVCVCVPVCVRMSLYVRTCVHACLFVCFVYKYMVYIDHIQASTKGISMDFFQCCNILTQENICRENSSVHYVTTQEWFVTNAIVYQVTILFRVT